MKMRLRTYHDYYEIAYPNRPGQINTQLPGADGYRIKSPVVPSLFVVHQSHDFSKFKAKKEPHGPGLLSNKCSF